VNWTEGKLKSGQEDKSSFPAKKRVLFFAIMSKPGTLPLQSLMAETLLCINQPELNSDPWSPSSAAIKNA